MAYIYKAIIKRIGMEEENHRGELKLLIVKIVFFDCRSNQSIKRKPGGSYAVYK